MLATRPDSVGPPMVSAVAAVLSSAAVRPITTSSLPTGSLGLATMASAGPAGAGRSTPGRVLLPVMKTTAEPVAGMPLGAAGNLAPR